MLPYASWSHPLGHREPTNCLTQKKKQLFLFLPQQPSTTYSFSATGEAWGAPPPVHSGLFNWCGLVQVGPT